MSITGLDKLNRRLDAIADQRAMLRKVQIGAVAEAKRLVPRKTGFLGRSIMPGPVSNDAAVIRATARYAAAVELGTKPHVIRPRNRKALAWAATGAGRRLSGRARSGARAGGLGGMRFAAIVHHPGTKAQPYLIPGAKLAARKFGRNYIIERWNRAA